MGDVETDHVSSARAGARARGAWPLWVWFRNTAGGGLGFTGPPEIWGLQWSLGETGAQSALSYPRLLPTSPPPHSAVLCFSPSSSPPARGLQGGGAQVHSGAKREVIRGKDAKAVQLGYLACSLLPA